MSNLTDPPVALTASETRFAKRLSPYIICKVGLAVNEGGTKQSSELHKESYDNYKKMASQIDLASAEIVKKMMVSSTPRESALPGIKKHLLDVLNPGDVTRPLDVLIFVHVLGVVCVCVGGILGCCVQS